MDFRETIPLTIAHLLYCIWWLYVHTVTNYNVYSFSLTVIIRLSLPGLLGKCLQGIFSFTLDFAFFREGLYVLILKHLTFYLKILKLKSYFVAFQC
jgi:hypothetical protein